MNYIPYLEEYRQKEIETYQNLDLEQINNIINLLEMARKANHKIFICGNGGSATTASHFCCDFNKGTNQNYLFECLNDNISIITAIANDINYESIFSFQLKNKMSQGDILICISGSGNSKNIINAIDEANRLGGITIAIVGYNGGIAKQKAQYNIHIPIDDMQIVEDLHMILDHIMIKSIVLGANNHA